MGGDGSAEPVRRWRLRRLLIDTAPLRIPPFRRLWTSTVVTAIGSQLTAVAVPKQIFDITHSSAYVGMSGLVGLVPLVVFALWGGAIADAVDRRKLIVVTNAVIALTSLGFWVQAAVGVDSVWLLFVLLGIQQGCFGVNQPTRAAAVVRLVGRDELVAANALTTTVMAFGSIVGPLLAGALIPVLGLPTLYLLDTIALCLALMAIWRLPALPPLEDKRRSVGLRSVVAGFGYLAAHRILLVSFLADIIAMVFGMPRALFPQLAEQTFGDPPGGGMALGILYAAIPIGSLLGMVFSGAFTHFRRYGVVIALAVVVWGVAIAGFGLMSSIWLAAVLLALGGAADVLSMVFRRSLLQASATDDMQGRLQGVFTVVVAGGPRLADLTHGAAGAAFGTTITITVGGLLVVTAMVIVTATMPSFWRYRAPGEEE